MAALPSLRRIDLGQFKNYRKCPASRRPFKILQTKSSDVAGLPGGSLIGLNVLDLQLSISELNPEKTLGG